MHAHVYLFLCSLIVMTALPSNQYSTTFSLDGVGSPASSGRGRHILATFKPIPLKSFTVVVSIVPADQLRQKTTTPSTPANLAVEGAGGAAGVGGPPCMANSIPAVGAPSTPGFMLSSSLSPTSSSFAFTKSFGDVFAMKKTSVGGGGGPLGSSGHSSNSFGSALGLGTSSAATTAAAAALKGLVDPSVGEIAVPNSQDSYRVHLLLPADYHRSSAANSAQSASPTSATLNSRKQVSLYSSTTDLNVGSGEGNNNNDEGLSAATSPLESLRTAKRKQAAQVNEHWMLFQQLVRFVLSVAPRFEPPPTPPGFAFPVDLGLSFVQNSSIFSAAEATQQGTRGVGGGADGTSSPLRSTGVAIGSLGGPTNPVEVKGEDPLVRGEEREARRAYMEAYLNSALQCDQVNCLKELQSFVGYDAYLKNELARFRATSRTPSSGSVGGSPGATVGNLPTSCGSQLLVRGNGSRTEFTSKGPLGSFSQSSSSCSQFAVSPTSSASRKVGGNVGAAVSSVPTAHADTAAVDEPIRQGRSLAAGPGAAGSRAASTHTADIVTPQMGGDSGGYANAFSASLPMSQPVSLLNAEELQRSSSNALTAAAAAAALVTPAVGSASYRRGDSGIVEMIGFTRTRSPLASSVPCSAASSSTLLNGSRHPHLAHSLKADTRRSSGTETAFFNNNTAGRRQEHGISRSLNESTNEGDGGAAALSPEPPPHDSRDFNNSRSPVLLGAGETDSKRDRQRHQNKGDGDDGDDDDGHSSTNSSQSSSSSSSFGSSVSHPGNFRKHGHHHEHEHHHQHHHHCNHHPQRRATPKKETTKDTEHDAAAQQQHHQRSLGQEMGEERKEEAEEERAVTAPPLLPHATPAATTTAALVSRADLKSLVSIAPETERMLTECFRMMDTEGCGYVSARDCLLFYLCATSDTFMEALHLYTTAASPSEDGNTAQRAPCEAQLEALLPAWMRDCESVVVGNPDYLMSCTRFVDAVREILAASTAMDPPSSSMAVIPAAAAPAIRGGSGGVHTGAEVDQMSSSRPHSKTQTSVGGEGASRNATPASSAPASGGLPAVLVGSQPSRDSRRYGEGTPLHADGHDAVEHAGLLLSHSATGSLPADGSDLSSPFVTAVPVMSAATTATAGPVASLEAWIDNYWLLMYSHLFTAIAALVVGAEAADLRAALLSVREKAYLEMTAQVATAVAANAERRLGHQPRPQPTQHSNRPDNVESVEAASSPSSRQDCPLGVSPLPLELVYPPWLLREVVTALAAQPPVLGCFDALELLSLVYVIGESGISVVGLEEVLQWLGTRTCQLSTRFSLEEFATMLDALSCLLPFADVLHCVRRRWTVAQAEEGREGHADGRATTTAEEGLSPAAARPPHAHLLRLVSRCATADPAGGREFNELVREQRWCSGGDGGGNNAGVSAGVSRSCTQCQLARGVLEQQAVLLETLTGENARLQRRIAELEAAATAPAVALLNVDGNSNTSTTAEAAVGKAVSDGAPSAATPPASTPSQPPFATSSSTAAPAGVNEAVASALPASWSDKAPHDTRVTPNTQTCRPAASSLASAEQQSSANKASHHTSLRSATLELVPVFTAETSGMEADHHHHHHQRHNNNTNDNADPRTQHRSSRQMRAEATQVARAGPLLYKVPRKYEYRQPSQLEFSFYLCRAIPREKDEEKNNASADASAGATAAATIIHNNGDGNLEPSSGQSVVPVEHVTIRDGAGNRVVAFKLSNNVLHILGRDVVARPARLPLVTAPLSSTAHHRSRSPCGGFVFGSIPSSASPLRDSYHVCERHNVNAILGREQNILHPSYDEGDLDDSDNPYSFLCRGRALGGPVKMSAPYSAERPRRDPSDGHFPVSTTAVTANGVEEMQPQRLVSRVMLTAHLWYTLKLRFNWEVRSVDISVTRTAGAAASTRRARAGEQEEQSAFPVYEGTVRMLDVAEVAGLNSIEVSPRREMLVAYCNVLLRYEAEQS